MKGFLTAPPLGTLAYMPKEYFLRDLADEGHFAYSYSNVDGKTYINDRNLSNLADFIGNSEKVRENPRLNKINWKALLKKMAFEFDGKSKIQNTKLAFYGYMMSLEYEKDRYLRKLRFSWKRTRNF